MALMHHLPARSLGTWWQRCGFCSPLISPDASLIRPPKNPQQFVRGFCDFRRVSNKCNSTCIGRSRPHGVHVAEDQHSAGEGCWHNTTRRRFHPKPRSHGPWSGISRVSKALFTSNGMDMILTLSAFNDLMITEKVTKYQCFIMDGYT